MRGFIVAFFRVGLAALCAVGLFLVTASLARAQSSWQYSPYRVHVWLTFDPGAGCSEPFRSQFSEQLVELVQRDWGAVWRVSASPPPEPLASAMTLDLELISRDDIEGSWGENVEEYDKLFLIKIASIADQYRVELREFDCRLRWWGPIVHRRLHQSQVLASTCLSAMTEAFAPLVRIEESMGTEVVGRLRAGGLVWQANSPAHVSPGEILRPIIRHNDRLGNVVAVAPLEWTFLQVSHPKENNPSLLVCAVRSGWRNPLRSTGSSRREQYALAVRKAASSSTMLTVQSQPVQRDETSRPLAGLEIFAKRPELEESSDNQPAAKLEDDTVLLGYTNARGKIQIPPGENLLRLIYVKSGGELLARLPIVPGLQSELIAQVRDDEPRLEAEGFIKGYQAELMDLVARREILATMIRQRIEEGNLEEADRLMRQFGQLPSQREMVQRLDERRNDQRLPPDRRVQRQINALYGETRKMLSEYLDPNLADRLLSELNKARSG